MSQVAHQASAYLSFCSMNRQGIVLLPLPRFDASPLQGYPQPYIASTHLCTWMERGTVRVEHLA